MRIRTRKNVLCVLAGILLCLAGGAHAEVLEFWHFTQGTLNWTGNAYVTNFTYDYDGLTFDTLAGDPFIVGPVGAFSSTAVNRVTIRMKSNANDALADLFYGPTFNANDRVRFTVNTDGAWHEYAFDLPALPANSRLRLDPTGSAGHIEVAWVKAETAPHLQTWDFTTGTLSWTGNAYVSNLTSTASGLEFDCSAPDPYIVGPVGTFSDDTRNEITIRMKSNANDGVADLFYGPTFNATDRVRFGVNTDNAWHEYKVLIPPQPSNARLRLDPTGGSGHIVIEWIKIEDSNELWIDNGTLEVGLDLNAGGAITYLSESGDGYSVINIHDRGRMIQQSYYAGQALDRTAEGQSASWSPWTWNPIQVGDVFGTSSTVVEGYVSGNTAYTKTIPKLWDMNDEEGQCYFEQWTSASNNVVHVVNRITCNRDPNDPWTQVVSRSQEIPALYTIGEVSHLYTYVGNDPFNNGGLVEIVNDPDDAFIWDSFTATEYWAANVDDSSGNGWGVGLFTTESNGYLGGFYGSARGVGGPNDDNTGYIAPIDTTALGDTSVYQYEYELIVGTLSTIRNYVYSNYP